MQVCNTRFGQLEEVVKQIIVNLLAYQPISEGDLILLLEWLDKVRVGLWLGYLYLNKNPMGITPSFHISSRIGRSDRMVTILRFKDLGEGLTFVGPEFLTYQLSPTCFGIRINGLCIVNASACYDAKCIKSIAKTRSWNCETLQFCALPNPSGRIS